MASANGIPKAGPVAVVLSLLLLSACSGGGVGAEAAGESSTPTPSASAGSAAQATPKPSATPKPTRVGATDLCSGLLALGAANQGRSMLELSSTGQFPEFDPSRVREYCTGNPTSTLADAIAVASASGPALGPGVILQDSWTDSVGYRYKLELMTPTATAKVDTADALPGQAKITWTFLFDATTTNATPERNAPLPTVYITPVWPAGSPVCAVENDFATVDAWSSNTPGQSEKWCTLKSFPRPLTLASDSAGTIAIGSSVVGKNTVPGSVISVPEASVPAFIEALKIPAMWALGRSTGEGLHTDCLLGSSGYYLSVATAETGCAP